MKSLLRLRNLCGIACLSLFLNCHPDVDLSHQDNKCITFRDQFHSVKALNETHAWAVGYFGRIFRTVNGGEDWQEQTSGTLAALFVVVFVDEHRGWVVGEGGVVLHTEDGGDVWSTQISDTQMSLLACDFSDRMHGVIVGEQGEILVTRDGGRRWEDRSLHEDINLNDVFFGDRLHGWIVGEFSSIFHTEDGGSTWARQRSTVLDTSLFGVSFKDEQEGWIVGQDGVMMGTRDKGLQWTEVDRVTESPLFDVLMKGDVGFAVGAKGTVLEFRRGEWNVSENMMTLGWIRSISMNVTKRGYLAGGYGVILGTDNGGRKWIRCNLVK